MAAKVLRVHVKSANQLRNEDLTGASDPYAVVYLNGKEVAKTKTINDNLSPVWNEHFTIQYQEIKSLKIEVFDSDIVGKESLGYIEFPGSRVRGRLHGGPLTKGGIGTIDLDIIADNKPDFDLGPPYSFPVHEKCSVDLYHDAAVDPTLPPIVDEHGAFIPYRANGAWERIYHAMNEAKRFIYITGWSIDTTKSLLRTTRQQAAEGKAVVDDETIGQLLARKAKDGLTVLVHIWDEATSSKYKKSGMMGTHDEETFHFLNANGVQCIKSYRDGGADTAFIFTHHQKSIILDAPLLGPTTAHHGHLHHDNILRRHLHPHQPHEMRRIIAFVGGLDLCDGRWDTPAHPLYRSLAHEHAKDFHNPWPVTEALGPREPWHDIHCKVEGQVARDILTNFVERWHKQAKKSLHNFLIDTSESNGFLPAAEEVGTYHSVEDAWKVQFFRSIDHDSATIEGVQKSIHDAYVNAIRAAEHFIYIENQYFLGSCNYWHDYRHANCNHCVPFEIVTKICQKIREKKPFCAYIVVPLFPEGIAESEAVQEVLKWQHMTQAFMYKMVHNAIQETYFAEDADARPDVTDYLSFYCLGNRESEHGSEAKVKNVNEISEPADFDRVLSKSRRFCIYVHAKMMIVDDAYVIVGSANINQRSMGGDRDTEMAIGGYQPHFLTPKGGRGDVYKFRLSLWAEHLRLSIPLFSNPSSRECARFVNHIAKKNWEVFARDEVSDMESHLMSYPIIVDQQGNTHAISNIPDTHGSIHGEAAALLINVLTT